MAEESGNQRNSMTRLLLILAGPAAACMVWFLLPSDLSAPARSVAAMGVLMAVWWMTEALPIEATGLVPLVALPLSGAMKLDQAAAPYADRVIFLFLGGMLLGAAMENWNLHRRFALWVISIVGTKPSRLISAFLFATAALSMFISNAAATVMMLPIGISVIKWVRGAVTPEMPGGEACLKHLGPAVVLAIAFGASIGGVGSIIGTPPIAQYAAYMGKTGRPISFAEWLVVGLPTLAVVLPLTWFILTKVVMPIPMKASPGVREQVMAERERQGPMTSGQWLTLVVFAGAAISWLLGQQIGLDDAVIAIIAALLLFILQARDPATGRTRPLLTWNEASRVPWGILLLFGGGLSLAAAIRHTGVDAYIAGGAGALAGLPLLVLLWIIAFVTILLTEFTSNTALVAAALPVGEALAQRLGVPPAAVLTTLTLTASLGFMLPAGTAPNALVFASKQVTMRQMMKAGLALDIACAALVPLLVVGLLRLGWLPGM